MKKILYIICVVCTASVFSGCSDFLDKLPDNRTELNTSEKVKSLLVSAYPTNSNAQICVMSADDIQDNGKQYSLDVPGVKSLYYWEDVNTLENDDPYSLWQGCFTAITAANQAIDALNEIGLTDENKNLYSEALLCRAYGYFILANTFCRAYNPETAQNQLGLPYITEPESVVGETHTRGNLADLYENIYKDIKEALPNVRLDDDVVSSVHFNKKAAYAFAAQFCLFYDKFDESIDYANEVLGQGTAANLRDWSYYASMDQDATTIANQYVSPNENCNLMLEDCYSLWAIVSGNYNYEQRYGHGYAKYNNEGLSADHIWGSRSKIYMSSCVYQPNTHNPVAKFAAYFQQTDPTNQVGYYHYLSTPFTTDKTLLYRAEAYLLKGDKDNAVNDINFWLASHTKSGDVTISEIKEFFDGVDYTPVPVNTKDEYSIRKHLNPVGFTLADEESEAIAQCILDFRRIECSREPERWYDVKRWGIEITHIVDGGSPLVLLKDDPRRAIQLPQQVTSAGIEANPRN